MNETITINSELLRKLYYMLRLYYNDVKIDSVTKMDAEELLKETKLNLEYKCSYRLDPINDPTLKEDKPFNFC